MPTRLRVDIAGYHHIINRGVNRCDIYNNNDDKEMFLQILNKSATIHKVTVHDYCLMDNHYHILLETTKDNLSAFMRVVNANYAKYFNKKYKRSGHLFQDRYKSKYIISDDYLYTLIRYIENNPLEASASTKVGKYQYTLAHILFSNKTYYPCCNDSILIKEFDIKTLNEFLGEVLSEDELQYLKTKTKQKIYKQDNKIQITQSKEFLDYFNDIDTKIKRDLAILNAYKDGYTQIKISSHLKLSTSLVSKIVKSGFSITGV
jgi:putative transposase